MDDRDAALNVGIGYQANHLMHDTERYGCVFCGQRGEHECPADAKAKMAQLERLLEGLPRKIIRDYIMLASLTFIAGILTGWGLS